MYGRLGYYYLQMSSRDVAAHCARRAAARPAPEPSVADGLLWCGLAAGFAALIGRIG